MWCGINWFGEVSPWFSCAIFEPIEIALRTLPAFKHIFVNAPEGMDKAEFNRKLFLARRRAEKQLANDPLFYVTTLSSQVVSYKGLVMPADLPRFYKDLDDERLASHIVVFHQRFSTNTLPKWPLAQPFRYVAHNGEINTIMGNRNWSVARTPKFENPLLPDLLDCAPLVNRTGSDSSSLDNMLEILVGGGMDLFRALRMLVPPAWQNVETMDADLRAFYEYNSKHMEAWDGPAGLVIQDGRHAVCMLDRNGLRPARYVITKNGYITLVSEIGVVIGEGVRRNPWVRRRAGQRLRGVTVLRGSSAGEKEGKHGDCDVFQIGDWRLEIGIHRQGL